MFFKLLRDVKEMSESITEILILIEIVSGIIKKTWRHDESHKRKTLISVITFDSNENTSVTEPCVYMMMKMRC